MKTIEQLKAELNDAMILEIRLKAQIELLEEQAKEGETETPKQ